MSAALHHESASPLREIGATPRERALAVIAEIGARHCVPLREIVGGNLAAQIVRARHEAVVAIAISPAFQSWSLPMISRLFGYRDHTTVIHILRKFRISRSGASRPAMNTPAQLCQESSGDKSNCNKGQASPPPVLVHPQHKELPRCGQTLAGGGQ